MAFYGSKHSRNSKQHRPRKDYSDHFHENTWQHEEHTLNSMKDAYSEMNSYNPSGNLQHLEQIYHSQGMCINGTVYFSNPEYEGYHSDGSMESKPSLQSDGEYNRDGAVTLYTGQKVFILPSAVNVEKVLSSHTL
mmetsp:Transcript_2834/g.4048  ORF Transcript_2834/g.4048 Transcript_2834/m.4048 type:complete len:135 (-) Transcript_2834:237-641(-)